MSKTLCKACDFGLSYAHNGHAIDCPTLGSSISGETIDHMVKTNVWVRRPGLSGSEEERMWEFLKYKKMYRSLPAHAYPRLLFVVVYVFLSLAISSILLASPYTGVYAFLHGCLYLSPFACICQPLIYCFHTVGLLFSGSVSLCLSMRGVCCDSLL